MTITDDFLPGGVHPDLAHIRLNWRTIKSRRYYFLVVPTADVGAPAAVGEDRAVQDTIEMEPIRVGAPVPYVGPPLYVWWWAFRDREGRGIAAPPQTVEYHWFAHEHFRAGWPEPDPAADWFLPDLAGGPG